MQLITSDAVNQNYATEKVYTPISCLLSEEWHSCLLFQGSIGPFRTILCSSQIYIPRVFIMQCAKSVIVGDSETGKSYLLSTYIRKTFPGEYHPDFLDRYSAEITIDNQIVQLHVLDTAGREGYERLRPLCYPNTHVVIICFSISDPSSFDNVTKKWLPEIKHYCPRACILLVGTKSDLRDNQEILDKLKEKNLSTIRQQQGIELAKQINAIGYQDCSSLRKEGLDEIFEKAAHAFLQANKHIKKNCIIL